MRGTSNGNPRGESSRPPVGLLLGLLLLSGALLGALAWWQRSATGERTRASVQTASPERATREASELHAPSVDSASGTGVRADARPVPDPVAVAAPTNALEGRLTVDGHPLRGGRLHVSSANGDWRREVPLEEDGSFRVEEPPPSRLVLAFACESDAPRKLLLPTVELPPGTEPRERLALDWATKEVNLRLAGGEAAAFARVEVEGPGYRTEVETNEHGRALLSLVGEGPFTFRVTDDLGRAREAHLTLEPDEDLATVSLSVEG